MIAVPRGLASGRSAGCSSTTLIDGLPALTEQLFTDPPSTRPGGGGRPPGDPRDDLPRRAAAPDDGARSASLTAIYLEEYARKERWYNRLLELNIQNLAAVSRRSSTASSGSRSSCAGPSASAASCSPGAIILTLVVLPTVIIASREAIRAVPDSIRQGGFALGATKWQVVWRQVLPASIPGIATGSILALSRAVGETAPLLLIGALQYVAFDPTVLGAFTALPVQIYTWVKLPDPAFQTLAAAAIIVLLGDRAGDERARDLPPQPLPTDSGEVDDADDGRADPTTIAPEPRAATRRRSRARASPRSRSARRRDVERREKVFHVADLAVSYNGKLALDGRHARRPREHRDGVHRAVRVRQVDLHPLLQPDERPDPRRGRRGHRAVPRQGSLRARTSTRSRSAAGSGWSSRSPTPSPSRSTTTSPSARARSG